MAERAAVLLLFVVAACGGEPEPRPSTPSDKETPARAAADPAPKKAQPEARTIDARAWWRGVALGEITKPEEDGERTVGRVRSDEGEERVAIDTAALADTAARDAGHRDAVAELVTRLRTDRDRNGARERLEALTKTERGPWENWLSWHDQHGDFLVFNAELARVDVDAARLAARRPETIGGLELHASLAVDRIRPSDPLRVRVALANVGDADAVMLNQRLRLEETLRVELAVHETNAVTPIALKEAAKAEPLVASDFTQLPPGQRVEADLDLAPLLGEPLGVGHYALRLTYVNDAAAPDGRAAWTGALPSLRMFVRVVPW